MLEKAEQREMSEPAAVRDAVTRSRVPYLQKPSMQILPGAQPEPAEGSHSPPRLPTEPQTECCPEEVVTALQRLMDGRLSHAA